MEARTTTEVICELLDSLPEEKWDSVIPNTALEWNRKNYKLKDDLVLSMYGTLKETRKTMKEGFNLRKTL